MSTVYSALDERLDRPVAVKVMSAALSTDPAFAEPADVSGVPAKVTVALARLAELRAGAPMAICSQGKMIPPMLAALTGAADPAEYKTPKGGGWVLSYAGAELVAVSRL